MVPLQVLYMCVAARIIPSGKLCTACHRNLQILQSSQFSARAVRLPAYLFQKVALECAAAVVFPECFARMRSRQTVMYVSVSSSLLALQYAISPP